MLAYLLFPGSIVTFCAIVAAAEGGGPVAFGIAATGISGILLVLERVLPLAPGEDALRDPEIAGDLGHTMLANGLAQVTDAGMLLLGALVAGRIGETWGLGLWPSQWPLLAQGTLAVLLADGLEYWRHRLVHHVEWLWPLHALHHDAERLHVLKSGRNTVVDMAVRSVVVYGPLAALGVPTALLLWYPMMSLVLGPIAHANVAFRIPAFLHRLVVTPPGHRIHHARDAALGDANFAVVTPLWDVLFGTFRDPAHVDPPRVGIEHRLPADFLGQALSPFLWRRSAPAPAAVQQ